MRRPDLVRKLTRIPPRHCEVCGGAATAEAGAGVLGQKPE
jgi:hypothetical protein